MEVWTFINKKTDEIIRCDIKNGDVEFRLLYYFTTFKYSPLWFVSTKEEAELAYQKEVHPKHSINYKRPDSYKIKLEDYYIAEFKK